MYTINDLSKSIFSIKNCLLSIKEGHGNFSKEQGGWPGTLFQVEKALTELEKINLSGITLRDHFALSATDDDINSFKDLVPKEDFVVELSPGRKQILHGTPATWRTTARYLYADQMLRIREKK